MAPFSHFTMMAWSLAIMAACAVVHLGIHLWRMFRR
jgi:hypothetical protein